MTIEEKFNMLLDFYNLSEYYEKGFKGQGVKIATMESTTSDHGYKVYKTLKTYAPDATIVSFTDTFDKSAIGDNGEKQNFPEFVDWCIKENVHIVTSSLCWSADKENERKAIEKLYEHGIIFFNSAGNYGDEDELGSGKDASNIDKGVVSVSGTMIDNKGKVSWAGYDFGSAVDAVVISFGVPYYDNGHWNNWSGTSSGTPFKASLIAVLRSSGVNVHSKNIMQIIDKYSDTVIYKNREYNHFKLPSLKDFDYTYEEPIKESQEDWKKEFAIAVEEMKKMNMTDGLRLKDNITREEVIVMMYRLYNKLKGE